MSGKVDSYSNAMIETVECKQGGEGRKTASRYDGIPL